jgi:hypothetical protein
MKKLLLNLALLIVLLSHSILAQEIAGTPNFDKYDKIGEQHNQKCEKFVKEVFPKSYKKGMSKAEVRNILVSFIKTEFGNPSNFTAIENGCFPPNNGCTPSFPFPWMTNVPPLLCSEHFNKQSENLKAGLSQILTTVSKNKFVVREQKIRELQKAFFNSTTLSKPDKEALLTACSVGIYSGNFWNEQNPTICGPITGADLAGAATGALFGGWGAIGGAAGASLLCWAEDRGYLD